MSHVRKTLALSRRTLAARHNRPFTDGSNENLGFIYRRSERSIRKFRRNALKHNLHFMGPVTLMDLVAGQISNLDMRYVADGNRVREHRQQQSRAGRTNASRRAWSIPNPDNQHIDIRLAQFLPHPIQFF